MYNHVSELPTGHRRQREKRRVRLAYRRYLWNVLSWRGASAHCDPSRTVCSCPTHASSSEKQKKQGVSRCFARTRIKKLCDEASTRADAGKKVAAGRREEMTKPRRKKTGQLLLPLSSDFKPSSLVHGSHSTGSDNLWKVHFLSM